MGFNKYSFYILMGGILFGFIGLTKESDSLFSLGITLGICSIILLFIERKKEHDTVHAKSEGGGK